MFKRSGNQPRWPGDSPSDSDYQSPSDSDSDSDSDISSQFSDDYDFENLSQEVDGLAVEAAGFEHEDMCVCYTPIKIPKLKP